MAGRAGWDAPHEVGRRPVPRCNAWAAGRPAVAHVSRAAPPRPPRPRRAGQRREAAPQSRGGGGRRRRGKGAKPTAGGGAEVALAQPAAGRTNWGESSARAACQGGAAPAAEVRRACTANWAHPGRGADSPVLGRGLHVSRRRPTREPLAREVYRGVPRRWEHIPRRTRNGRGPRRCGARGGKNCRAFLT